MPEKPTKTPYYVFYADHFSERIKAVKEVLGDIPLTFSIKANPFLLNVLPDEPLIRHVEVCSPGELAICREKGIDGKRIIYSGVMKEEWDVLEALEYGVDILTSESRRHYELIKSGCKKLGKKCRVILRLTSGNQFGMSEEDILSILKENDGSDIEVFGIHFYSGTAKNKLKQIDKDLTALRELLTKAKEETGFIPGLVEYGPGLSAEYFEAPYDEKDMGLLKEVSESILSFGKEYSLGIEMGRFLSAPSGSFYTSVCDIKTNKGVNYLIVDGGIHHLKYYGQNMAMKVPPIDVIRDGAVLKKDSGEQDEYCICGSLCTTADVLIRSVNLPKVKIGDIIEFRRCGAYSVSEGALAFLSRSMPEIWIEDKGLKCYRPVAESWKLNC